MERRRNLALRYCFIAWVSLLRWVLASAAIVFLLAVAITRDTSYLIVAGCLVGGVLLAAIIYFIESPGVRCLMCGASLLRRLACVPHGNAKHLCGSHSLRSTVKLATFPALMDCPYCDGHFRLASKKDDGDYRQREHMSASGRTRASKNVEGLPTGPSAASRTRR